MSGASSILNEWSNKLFEQIIREWNYQQERELETRPVRRGRRFCCLPALLGRLVAIARVVRGRRGWNRTCSDDPNDVRVFRIKRDLFNHRKYPYILLKLYPQYLFIKKFAKRTQFKGNNCYFTLHLYSYQRVSM